MIVSREYFNKVSGVCGELEKFVQDVQDDEGALSVGYNGEVLFLFDLVRCYRKMGIPYNLESPENLALYMILLKGSVEYSQLQQSIAMYGEETISIVRDIEEELSTRSDSDGWLFFSFFGEDDIYFKLNYLNLLYSFCKTVAMADGKIGGKEFLFLASLMDESSALDAQAEKKKNKGEGGPLGMSELDDLIGLAGVKNDIRTLTNFAKIQKMRKDKGLKTTPLSLHCVFSGNPGTGKTTVARILGNIYRDLGLSISGKVVETDRSGLVGEYVGQTAIKTNAVIDSALDGILFIDEAYTLVSSEKNDFGKEAITTLLKRMEDDRDRLIVILAGYTDQMEEFLQANPGLNSRFGRRIIFEDYSADELIQIFQRNLQKFEYTISDDALEILRRKTLDVVANKPADFGNARYMRNVFEQVLQSQANRVAMLPDITTYELCRIVSEDIERL